MTKINPLLDAMSEIDDNIITNTQKSAIRMKTIFISAAAAVASLAVITGAAAVHQDQVYLNNKKAIEYNFTVKENVTVPTHEELLDMGARLALDTDSNFKVYRFNVLPSEMFQMSNVHPLMNDNFIEEVSDVHFRVDGVAVGDTFSDDEVGSITMEYSLFDKQIGKMATFVTSCKVDERAELSIELFGGKSLKHKTVNLNDGSKALVYYSVNSPNNLCEATFSYDGIIYEMRVENSSYDEITQILNDLGVL